MPVLMAKTCSLLAHTLCLLWVSWCSASVIIFFALGPALTVQPPSRGESDHLCPQFLARVSHMAIWSSTMCVGGGEPPYRRWSGVGKEWHSIWWFPTETNTIFVRTVLWHELILTPASRCENWYEKLRDMSTALKGASLDALFLEIISQNP